MNKKISKIKNISGITLLNQDNENTLNIIGIYRPPQYNTPENTWHSIYNSSNVKLMINTIFTGDVNAHHTFWNCQKTDKNGINLMNFLNNVNMNVINDKTVSHIGNNNTNNSNIDLVITTEDIYPTTNCQVLSDPWGSDHWPIQTNIVTETSTYRKKSNRISNKKTNWKDFEIKISSKEQEIIDNINKIVSPTKKYEFLCDQIRNIVKNCSNKPNNDKVNKSKLKYENINPQYKIDVNVPEKIIKNINKNKNPVEWWDLECEEALNKRKKIL